jgi:hypothetical protein
MPQVFFTPAGTLQLVLREEGGEGHERAVWCLNLETGEVRQMMRSLKELQRYGWTPYAP